MRKIIINTEVGKIFRQNLIEIENQSNLADFEI